MNFLKRIFSIFSGGSSGSDRNMPIYALNFRCNEPVEGAVDRFNELSQIEDGDYAYYVRKVLHTTGENRCFGETEVQLWFDRNKTLQHYEVQGGRWLDAEEYAREVERFNAPPEEDGEEAPAETSTGSQEEGSLETTNNE